MMSIAMPLCNCCGDAPVNRPTQSLAFRRRACARAQYSCNPPRSLRSAIALSRSNAARFELADVEAYSSYSALLRGPRDSNRQVDGEHETMLSLVEMRPNAAVAASGCRPLSLPPRLGGLLLTDDAGAQTLPIPLSQPCQTVAGGKLPTPKANRAHLGLAERAQHRRSWHLNGARDRLPSLSLATAPRSLEQLHSPSNSSSTSRPQSVSDRDDIPELRSASCILPFLFIGGERDASDLNRLEAMRVRYVLNVTGHIPCYFEGRPGFVYQRIPANDCDQQDLKRYFHTAVEFIERARQANVACLVHCVAGMSRSPTVVLAYLMSTRSWSMMEAYNFVKERRSWIAPNLNFVGQLYDFERELARRNERPPSTDSACHTEQTDSEPERPSGDVQLRTSNSRTRLATATDSERDSAICLSPTDSAPPRDAHAHPAAFPNGAHADWCSTASKRRELDTCKSVDASALALADCANTENSRDCVSHPRIAKVDENHAEPEAANTRAGPDPSEQCRSAKRRHEYYALAATCSSSILCGMETD